MTRREGRDSDSKRHRSRFDREPSPKRPRRDGKPATERPSNNLNLDSGDHSDQDQKHRRRLQDALPLETPLAPDQKVEAGAVGEESDKKSNGHNEGTKHPSNSDKAPRSKSYFQHDERGNARQVSRSHSRREDSDRGWWRDSKDLQNARETNRKTTNYTRLKDQKSHVLRDDNHAWRHDGFHKMETEAKPPARKRPAFREQKAPVESESVEKTVSDPIKPSQTDRTNHPILASERKEERGNNHRHLDRPEKPPAWDRDLNRNKLERGSFSSRERYTGSGTYRGRERFTGRQGYRPIGVRVEKWKHDLYDEANRSPTAKNEEDQIAKVEALLSK